MSDRQTIAVWFSCGAASAVAAKLTVDIYASTHDIRILNTPVANEHHDNQRFADDVANWLELPIERVINPKFPTGRVEDIFQKRGYMSGIKGAPCTLELKKEARYAWEKNNHADWHVLGFTADEKKRHDNFVLSERSNVLPVLIDAGITKEDCYRIISDAGIRLPEIYSIGSRFGSGFPNANCIGCVKATSPTYWNHVRETFPDVFADRAAQSRAIGKNGVKLVRHKGKRIYLDELPPDAIGKPMHTMKFECGIFCEPEEIL